MKTRVLLFLLPVVVGNLAGIVSARPEDGPQPLAQGREAREPGPRLMIELRGNLLSVRIHNAPWDQVLKELTRQTGMKIQVLGPLVGTVSQEFEALPLEQGLLQLFGDADVVLSPAKEAQPRTAAKQPIHVWLIPKKGSVGQQVQPPSAGMPSAAQAEASESGEQLAAVDHGEPAQEEPAPEPVVKEEEPGTEIIVQEQEPASEVEILGEEIPQAEQSSAGLMAAAQADVADAAAQLAAVAPGESGSEAPADEPVIQEEHPGTVILVREEAPASEVEILGEERPEVEQQAEGS